MELTIEIIDTISKIMTRDKLTSLSLDQGHIKLEITREAGASTTAQLAPVISEPLVKPEVTELKELKEVEAPQTAVVSSDANLIEITSPMVGVFYESSQPGNPPYVAVNQTFSEGDTLCIVEAMKLMNEITAEYGGTVKEICVKNGDVVEYGQVLFKVEKGA